MGDIEMVHSGRALRIVDGNEDAVTSAQGA